jgi:hypothetical protein
MDALDLREVKPLGESHAQSNGLIVEYSRKSIIVCFESMVRREAIINGCTSWSLSKAQTGCEKKKLQERRQTQSEAIDCCIRLWHIFLGMADCSQDVRYLQVDCKSVSTIKPFLIHTALLAVLA